MSGPQRPPDDDPEGEAWAREQHDAWIEFAEADVAEQAAEAMVRHAQVLELIDFGGAPKPPLRLILFRKSDAIDQWHQSVYMPWYASQREAVGLPPLPTPPGAGGLLFGSAVEPEDAELAAAMRRFDRVSDRMPVRGHSWSAEEPRVIRVVLDPYKERHAKRIRKACLPIEARVEPAQPRPR